MEGILEAMQRIAGDQQAIEALRLINCSDAPDPLACTREKNQGIELLQSNIAAEQGVLETLRRILGTWRIVADVATYNAQVKIVGWDSKTTELDVTFEAKGLRLDRLGYASFGPHTNRIDLIAPPTFDWYGFINPTMPLASGSVQGAYNPRTEDLVSWQADRPYVYGGPLPFP